MSKAEQYVQKLKECQQMDTEGGHCEADRHQTHNNANEWNRT
ncbi:hypothetical protein [Segatella copri]|nr:hypothetical protein [Segatella copri]